MDTPLLPFRKIRHGLSALLAFGLLILNLQTTRADIPDRDRSSTNLPALSGMYKVAASNDPFFPIAANREWFVDFGPGAANGKTSGKAAVSLRQNPNVKVRVMVWQIFPGTGRLYLGNQFHEGSRQAVAAADWQIRNTMEGVLLERHGFRIVLRHADTADY